jgi:hypothetical protein
MKRSKPFIEEDDYERAHLLDQIYMFEGDEHWDSNQVGIVIEGSKTIIKKDEQPGGTTIELSKQDQPLPF